VLSISETFRTKLMAKKVRIRTETGEKEYEYLTVHIPSEVAKRLGLKKGDVVEIHIVKLSTGDTAEEEADSTSSYC